MVMVDSFENFTLDQAFLKEFPSIEILSFFVEFSFIFVRMDFPGYKYKKPLY